MRITLPLPPNMANKSWGHWAKKRRARTNYMLEATAWHPKRLPAPLPRATIKATLYVWSTMDGDNLRARLKWTIDWLVNREFIPDDSPKYLEWLPTEQVVDRRNQRVVIELEEVT